MSDTPMTNKTPRRAEAAETIEPGVAHVEITPGAPAETAGSGPLQVDDETGERSPRDAGKRGAGDGPTTGRTGQA